jgi:hypothetical protein
MNSRNTKWLVLAVVLAVVAIFLSLRLFAATSTQPKIAWSTSNVYAGITSTTTITKTLTFTSDQVLRNISLEGVPPTAQFVKIQPNAFAQVPAGQPQTVLLTFSAPATAQFGAYDGTIHIRAGSTTFPQTLKTSVTFAVVPLPPDPGPAGMTTLAGIDADGDGVRDDVERYIALTYPKSAKTRAALTQSALALETEVIGAAQSYKPLSDAIDCIGFTLTISAADVAGGLSARKAYFALRAIVLNTPDRANAFFRADSQFGSGVRVSTPYEQRGTRCITNPSLFPN